MGKRLTQKNAGKALPPATYQRRGDAVPKAGDGFTVPIPQLDMWRDVIDHIDDGVVICDDKGDVVLVNPAARAMVGEDVLWKNPVEHPDLFGLHRLGPDEAVRALGLTLVCELRSGHGESEELMMRSAPGGPGQSMWVRVTARPILGPDGRRMGSVVTFRDIGPEKGLEGVLRLHQRAMECASAGIVISDATQQDNPLIYVNEGFLRMTGYTREEVVGRNCRFLQCAETHPESRDLIRQALREERSCSLELLNCRKNGSTFWNHLTITPVRDVSGRVTNFIGIQSDITDRVRAEEELKRTTRQLQAVNDRMQRDLDAAVRVQQALLPPRRIGIPGVDFAWRYLPCEGLAGDAIDVFRLDEKHVGFYVFDVSGHGVASALLATAVNRVLSPTVTATSLVKRSAGPNGEYTVAAPADVATELNRMFRWDSRTAQFFTICYATLNRLTGRCRFVCAGHPGIIHLPAQGTPVIHQTPGLPIGIGDGPYGEEEFVLAPGDQILLYSDGVIETMSPGGELFGRQRLLDLISTHRSASPQDLLDTVLGAVDAWRESGEPRDDLSLLACGFPREPV